MRGFGLCAPLCNRRRRPSLDCARAASRAACTRASPRVTWKTLASSSERLHEAVDEPVELGVALAHGVDLADGVDHRRMVLAPEPFADLGQARIGEGLGQVHGDLPRL